MSHWIRAVPRGSMAPSRPEVQDHEGEYSMLEDIRYEDNGVIKLQARTAKEV